MGQTEQHDRIVAAGCKQFMKTLHAGVGARAIVITIQQDGHLQVHSTIDEPDLTSYLMKVAGERRPGDSTQ